MQKRFVDSARTAVLFATGACILISTIAALNDYQHSTLDGASYASIWVVFWPLTFASSLWWDVRRSLGRQIIASASRSEH